MDTDWHRLPATRFSGPSIRFGCSCRPSGLPPVRCAMAELKLCSYLLDSALLVNCSCRPSGLPPVRCAMAEAKALQLRLDSYVSTSPARTPRGDEAPKRGIRLLHRPAPSSLDCPRCSGLRRECSPH